MKNLFNYINLKINQLDVKISYPAVFWLYMIFVIIINIRCQPDTDNLCLLLSPLVALFYMFSSFLLIFSSTSILIVLPAFIILMNAYKLTKRTNVRYYLERIASFTTVLFIINLVISFIILLMCNATGTSSGFCSKLFL